MRKPFSVSVFARLLSTDMSEVKNLPAAYIDECTEAANELSASIADVLEESADSLQGNRRTYSARAHCFSAVALRVESALAERRSQTALVGECRRSPEVFGPGGAYLWESLGRR